MPQFLVHVAPLSWGQFVGVDRKDGIGVIEIYDVLMLKVLLTHKWGSISESQHHYWYIQGLLNSKWLEFWLWASLSSKRSAAWLSPSCHIAENNNRGCQGRKPISSWGNRKKHENGRKMQHIVKFLQQGHWAQSCKQIGLPTRSTEMISSHWTQQWFFSGCNFTKFQPGKYDFNLYEGYFVEKMAQIRQISKEKNSKSPDFYDK